MDCAIKVRFQYVTKLMNICVRMQAPEAHLAVRMVLRNTGLASRQAVTKVPVDRINTTKQQQNKREASRTRVPLKNFQATGAKERYS